MSDKDPESIPIQDYMKSKRPLPVYQAKIVPASSPIDLNVQFIIQDGWNQWDRLRFHTEFKALLRKEHPVAEVIEKIKPHILLRRYNRDTASSLQYHSY